MPPKTLNKLSGMPQMRAAFKGWTVKITLYKITQNIVNGFNFDTKTPITFNGTVQPLDPEQIKLKPDGQRSWDWLQIHCVNNTPLNLKTNDRIQYDGIYYKVMNVLDYKLNNYQEYHLIKDYQDA